MNEYGVRAKNQWISVENENSEDVNGEEVDTLWYYFGDNGKAYKATAEDGDDKRKKLAQMLLVSEHTSLIPMAVC